CSWDDVHNFAAAAAAKRYGTGFKGEEGVVFSNTDVTAWMVFGTTLANQNFTGVDVLATVAFDAEALGVGVTTVPCGARPVFCCHELNPLRVLPDQRLLDVGDLLAGPVLAVTLTLFVAGLGFVFLDDDFFAAQVLEPLGGNFDVFQLFFV